MTTYNRYLSYENMHLSRWFFSSILFCPFSSPEGYVLAIFVLRCLWTSSCLNCEANVSNVARLGMYRLYDYVLYDLIEYTTKGSLVGHVRRPLVVDRGPMPPLSSVMFQSVSANDNIIKEGWSIKSMILNLFLYPNTAQLSMRKDYIPLQL